MTSHESRDLCPDEGCFNCCFVMLKLVQSTNNKSLHSKCTPFGLATVVQHCPTPPSYSGMRERSSCILSAAWVWAWTTCACCLQCAPGCLQLQAISDADGSAVLHNQSCTSISSDSSTPALSLPPASLNASWTAAPTTSPLLPVLDLCHQVQSVWLMPGPLG